MKKGGFIILTMLLAGSLALLFFMTATWGGFALGAIVSAIIYFALLITIDDLNHEFETFANPRSFSESDNGMTFRVAEIREGRVGVVPYGYIDSGIIGDLTLAKTFYWIKGLPPELHDPDSLFRVQYSPGGIVFRKVALTHDRERRQLQAIGDPLTA